MNSLLHDNLSGIRQIKSYVRENEEHARFNRVSDATARGDARGHAGVGALQSVDGICSDALGIVLVLGFGAHARS